MQQLCYILLCEGNLSLAPTIINLSKILEEHGYLVTIFATHNNAIPQTNKIGCGVNILYLTSILNNLYQVNSIDILTNLIKIVQLSIHSFQYFAYILKNERRANNSKQSINIVIDLHGLIIAFFWFYLFKQKFIFLSLELEPPKRYRYISKIFLEMAKLAYKKSDCVIIQDEDRFKTLCDYYQYQHPKVFYLPNSSLNDCLDTNNGNFFRDKFNLSKEKFPYIVLQAGMLNELVCSKSLAHAFASIDSGFALIFHGVAPKVIKEEDPYIQSLRQVNSKNLFLSLTPLPYDQVDKIYASSTIGLAFYANMGDNFTKIAMASGKLAFYLKHGKPVLVSNFPSLSQLIEKYQFGIIINEPSDTQEIKAAVDKILIDYDTYSNNAKFCFEAEFDFGKKMKPILSFIESL